MAVADLAEHLAAGRLRFLTDVQIGQFRRLHGLTRDEVRTAAILADRIRRRRQMAEASNSFRVDGLVELDAPVVLPIEVKPKGMRKVGRRGR